MPLSFNASKKIHCEQIQENIIQKMVGWKAKLLLQIGRTTLIKVVGNSIPSYLMSTITIPKIITNNIDRVINRLTSDFNKALISKIGWQLINSSSAIWKDILAGKYLKNNSIFDANQKPNNSWIWKGTIKQLDFLKGSVYFQVNNDLGTKVWSNPWVPTLPSFKSIPKNTLIHKDPSTIVLEPTLEEPRRWNIILLQALFQQDSVEIMKIPLV